MFLGKIISGGNYPFHRVHKNALLFFTIYGLGAVLGFYLPIGVTIEKEKKIDFPNRLPLSPLPSPVKLTVLYMRRLLAY